MPKTCGVEQYFCYAETAKFLEKVISLMKTVLI